MDMGGTATKINVAKKKEVAIISDTLTNNEKAHNYKNNNFLFD